MQAIVHERLHKPLFGLNDLSNQDNIMYKARGRFDKNLDTGWNKNALKLVQNRNRIKSHVKNIFMKRTKLFVCVIILLSASYNLFSKDEDNVVTPNFKKQFIELFGNDLRYNEVENMTSKLQNFIEQEKEECDFPYIRNSKVYELLVEGLDSANCFEVIYFCYNQLVEYGEPKILKNLSNKIKDKVSIFSLPKLSAYLNLTEEEKNELLKCKEKKEITIFEKALWGDSDAEELLIKEYRKSLNYEKILYAIKLGKVASKNCLNALCNSFDKKEIIEDYNFHYTYSFCTINGLKYAFPNEPLFSCELKKTLKDHPVSIDAYSDNYLPGSQSGMAGQNNYLQKVNQWIVNNLKINLPPISKKTIIMYVYVMETE
ncbi:MAG: hypothetical protein ABFC55_02720 [Tenuifilaceae bacterium]